MKSSHLGLREIAQGGNAVRRHVGGERGVEGRLRRSAIILEGPHVGVDAGKEKFAVEGQGSPPEEKADMALCISVFWIAS